MPYYTILYYTKLNCTVLCIEGVGGLSPPGASLWRGRGRGDDESNYEDTCTYVYIYIYIYTYIHYY